VFKRRRQPSPGSGLHQCPVCHDDYVVPVGAAPFDPGTWGLRLRCGQCERFRDVVVGDDVAKQYDLDLSRGRAEIAAALADADHERMTAEAQHFIAALKRDLIDAGDFSPD
jgi:hypothetical protein